MKFYEKSNSFLNPPFFISMTTAAKLVQLIAILLAYLIQLDVDVIGNMLDKLCRSCHGNKKGGFKIILDSFHQAS
jgi:hypothetical protein